LYFVSLLTLAVMLVWITYYYYQSTSGACSNLFSDTVAREQVQAFWREGKVTVLMQQLADCGAGDSDCSESAQRNSTRGLKALFSDRFELLSGMSAALHNSARQVFEHEVRVVSGLSTDCKNSLEAMLLQPQQGNRLLLIDHACLNAQKGANGSSLIPFGLDAEEDAGLMVFVRNAPQGGAPKVLACAGADGWKDSGISTQFMP
jgi:hypothetical protein